MDFWARFGVQALDEQFDDLDEVGIRQRLEEDDFVKTVEELRVESLLHFLLDQLLHLVGDNVFAVALEAQALLFIRWRAPMFEVMMRITFLKSTVLPRPSVNWPSSNTWSRC